MIINGCFFSCINEHFFGYDGVNANFDFSDVVEKFTTIVIFAPIIETILSQYLLYKLLRLTKIKSFYFYLIAMSVVFSLFHTYNWLYMLMTFVSALILNNFYLKTTNRYGNAEAALFTIFIHAAYNAFGFFFVDWINKPQNIKKAHYPACSFKIL